MRKRKRDKTTFPFQLGVLEKLSSSLSFLILSLVITRDIFALFLMFGIVGFLLCYNIKIKNILLFLRIPLIFALLGLLSIILVLEANEHNALWIISQKHIQLSITSQSLAEGKVVLWRVINSLLSLYTLIATTTTIEKNVLAEKLHIPKPLIELGVLSFRYIQILDKKKHEIQTAQRLRLGYHSYKQAFHSSTLLLSTIFIYSITTFRTHHQALLCRGYQGTLYHSTDITTLARDRWWVLSALVIFTTLVLVFYRMYA